MMDLLKSLMASRKGVSKWVWIVAVIIILIILYVVYSGAY